MATEIPGNNVTHFPPPYSRRVVVAVVVESSSRKGGEKRTADCASVSDQRTSTGRGIGQWLRERVSE